MFISVRTTFAVFVLLSLISGKLTFLYDDYTATIENCFAPMVVKRTLFSTPIASFLFGTSFNTYLLRAYQSMKFETRSGCKLLSISLCNEREYLALSLSPQQKLWCRDQDQAQRHVWSHKEADWPSENATAMLRGRSVFTPVVYS